MRAVLRISWSMVSQEWQVSERTNRRVIAAFPSLLAAEEFVIDETKRREGVS